MRSAISKSAMSKIQTIALVLVVLFAAFLGLAILSSRFSNPSPPSPTATPAQTASSTATPSPTMLPSPEGEIIIGVEYVVPGVGEAFSGLGIAAVKPLPTSFSWDKMQTSPGSPIDFSYTDKYVKEFQDSGFTVIVLGLKVSGSILGDPWMIDPAYPKTQAVNPTYYSNFSHWVKSIVERYDKDGVDDMAGLKYPVKHYEIGVEFSSYQPEPTEIYLKTLELGYKAAHEAYDKVMVGHSAFLLTPVFKDNPSPDQYEAAFDQNLVGTEGKGLRDIRMVLDRLDLFDFINVHNLGWPYEIEQIVKWVKYETAQREYQKPIIISDTSPTPFAGFGSATKTSGNNLAIMTPPATEEDRSRLVDYFKKLISADAKYIEWLRAYLAADTVQRVVIAAEQKIALINTAFTSDLPGANLAIFQGAAGNAGWGGMVDVEGGRVTGKRPAYYALRQLQENLRGYDSIVRVNVNGDDEIRLYRVTKQGDEFFIAWYGYQKLYLPDDKVPAKSVQIEVGVSQVTVESMTNSTNLIKTSQATANGVLSITLTPEPIYIFKR